MLQIHTKEIADDVSVREYVFLPDSWAMEGVDHPASITVRIGQYCKSDKDTLLSPRPYFIEFESRDEDKYRDVLEAIKCDTSHQDIEKIEHRKNGDETDVSYVTEYQMKRSRFSLAHLEHFMLEAFDKMVTERVISANDANLFMRNERSMLPPSGTDIMSGRSM